jgi:hypothetical protein
MLVGHWWLIPAVPASWEAEVRRVVVRGQSWQKSLQDSISMQKSWVTWVIWEFHLFIFYFYYFFILLFFILFYFISFFFYYSYVHTRLGLGSLK